MWLFVLDKGNMSYKQNYKEKQELMKNSRMAAGLVSDRYGAVSSIVFRLTYYQTSLNRILMTRTLNFFPGNYAYFHIACMRDECVEGGFDLSPVVADMVKNRKTSIKGKVFCHGKNAIPGHSDISGHASLRYEINIDYKKNNN